jgi:TBC1 domain family member 10
MNGNQPDKYGFFIQKGNTSFKQVPQLTLNARMSKWEEMIGNWSDLKEKNFNLLKKRVRKGIPDPLRSRVWLLISEVTRIKDTYPNHLYFRLTNIDEDPQCMNSIKKDLDRTYPGHEIYRTPEGQESLSKILRAYAHFDPEIGYCQGMGYVVGIARMYMDEENTFWVLVSLMNNYQMRGMFKAGMEEVYRSFYKANALLKHFEPKVWKTLHENQLSPQIYATQWFMTIYSNYPIETVLRIWDCFLLEGPKILYRVYIGFFRMNKKHFKNLNFEELMAKIRQLESTCDCDALLKSGFSISLSKKKLKEIDREYAYSPNMELISWTLK